MTEENPIVDVESSEVPKEPEMSYRERKDLEEARVRTLNKMIKNYRRKMKNPLTAVKNMDNK